MTFLVVKNRTRNMLQKDTVDAFRYGYFTTVGKIVAICEEVTRRSRLKGEFTKRSGNRQRPHRISREFSL